MKCKCGKEPRIFLEHDKFCFECYHKFVEKQKDTTYCLACGRGIEKENKSD